MIFNSVSFFVFLLVVISLYWTLPRRPRLWLLFASSLLFYGFWRVEFLPVMLLSAFTDYSIGLWLPKAQRPSRRLGLLLVSLTVNLGLLLYFKYLMFFADNAASLAQILGWDWSAPAWEIILPLGISFYTFQTISYTVDVYRGVVEPERDPILYGTYVTFFPQLIAGPVLRASEVLYQLTVRPTFSVEMFASGVRRIILGLFLKVVLADGIAPLVDHGFSTPIESMSALDVWTLAFMFGFQIYFDFSAYSHIAIGCGLLMGINFPENFAFPYAAHSPKDFWKRWHISLSSWIRDYLYLPLTGAKVGATGSRGGLGQATTDRRRNIALFLTWAIMGLWHGANWTFVVWGLYHATWVIAHRLINPSLEAVPSHLRKPLGWAVSLPIAMLGWIPFRAESVSDVFAMYATVLNPSAYGAIGFRENTYLIAAILLLGIMFSWLTYRYVLEPLKGRPLLYRSISTVVLGVALAFDFIYLRPISQYIYFQF